MSATEEQLAIIAEIQKESCDFLKVSACSGSGKTWTLVEIVKAIAPKQGLYMAYNKAIATEAAGKFPEEVECLTTHKLAYRHTVIPCSLKVGSFGYRDVKVDIPYEYKLDVVAYIKMFCLSEHTSFIAYANGLDIPKPIITICEDVLADMASGDMTCTHEFYMKLFHILVVNGSVKLDQMDILLLDEAGDLNPVTLEIFKALPAKKKVMVGDPNQNIYSFNHTINGFEVMSNVGVQMYLSKSFRVSTYIAKLVEDFAKDTFDPDMRFKGTKHNDTTITTRAYITRTNGQMIERMMELNRTGTPYALVRKVKSIFALPLALISLKRGVFIKDPTLKFLQHDTEDYYRSSRLQKEFDTPLKYIMHAHRDNPTVKTAVSMLMKHGPRELLETQAKAIAHEHSKAGRNLVLCTSHSSKGLEFDSVEIGIDTTQIVDKIMVKHRDSWTSEEVEELRLFYVAVTRARKDLVGATSLDKYIPEDITRYL